MNHTHHAHGHGHHGACASGTPDAAAKQATDPVCGMTVDPQSSAGSVEHKGTKYYFCSKHCLEQFKADPAKYLHKSSAPVPAAA